MIKLALLKVVTPFFNIRRLFNILCGPTPPDIPEILLSLDAEKAFDRVEWDYLFYTLKQFGFGEKFISWIKVLYSSPLAAVRTNNNLSSYFPLHRGTRQGCPLSPLLFAIAIEPLALVLRGEINIKGIRRYDSDNKVSLYADDMLLYLSHPLTSLPNTLNLLEEFGKISGYKINLQKCEIMPVNVVAKQIDFGLFPLKVSPQKFKYLGIWITHAFKDIFKANFSPLLTRLKQDMERWSLLPLSLGGRINIIKMNVLPKFLYIFQCIPLHLSKSFFMAVDNLVSGFIWNKKNPRIRKRILQQHRKHGGLSLPNFQFYYWAANIRSMLFWKDSPSGDTTPEWLRMENSSCVHTSLHSLLCSKLPLLNFICKFTSNPIVKHSFRILTQFRRSFSLRDLPTCAPITRNHQFMPSIIDSAFQEWADRGVATIENLFIDNTFASFDQLKLKFNIQNSHLFRFLQLRSFVSTSFTHFPSQPPNTLLNSILKLNSGSKGNIGNIYSLLNTYNLEPLTSLKTQWEGDLGCELPEETWERALDRIHSSSICLRHTVIQFKVMHCLHWSKVRLAKFAPSIDPICDRCRQAPATLSHMFWFCSKLDNFWQSIFKTFSDVLQVPIELSAITAIFGITPQDTHLSRQAKNMIAFASFIARRLILFKWKEKLPPTFKMWVNDLLHHLVLEKIRYSTRGCIQKFHATWKPFLSYIEKLDVTNIGVLHD